MEDYKIKLLLKNCENSAKRLFEEIAENALTNQGKVLNAFAQNRISGYHFYPTTGYGYDDNGRDTLNRLFADIFGAEDAIVSPLIVNGTHALTLALFGVLRPGDTILSIAGKPYDTLDEVISGKNNGSLKEFGVNFTMIELTPDGDFDYVAIEDALAKHNPKLIFIQRSKGYLWREALSIQKIEKIASFIRKITPKAVIFVDNCYGEFVESKEPTQVGCDLIAGSLIKNAGGGIAPTGGYIAGRKDLIEQVSYRLTAPSLGLEVGSYVGGYRLFYQGLFLAPSIVKNALMGNVLTSYAMAEVGCETMPKAGQRPYDIINSIKLKSAERLINFCKTIQSISPVESNVSPEPWGMPGYNDQVIMAAGTFIQGASLELSADGAVREPYTVYLQGGLSYEHCKLALIKVLQSEF